MSSRIVIAGGGLIGCSIAWRLATRGMEVRVIEAAQPGMAASRAAAGMLAPVGEADHAALRSLAVASRDLFPAFVDELRDLTGIDAELELTGRVDVALTHDHLLSLRERFGGQVRTRDLEPADARALEPALAGEIAGAILSEADGSVDNRKLARAAWAAAAAAGAEFHCGTSVREVVCSRDRFEAVLLSTGERVGADAVVICAGAWSGALRGLPLRLPVFPVRGQILALAHIPRLLGRIVMSETCYIVPRADGRLIVGATVERAGFDARTTAGGIATLLAGAARVVPAVSNATFCEAWAGLRPGTPDDLPILGADPRAAGVFYATGHFRNGILLAPATAEAIACLTVGETPLMDMDAFSITRFHG